MRKYGLGFVRIFQDHQTHISTKFDNRKEFEHDKKMKIDFLNLGSKLNHNHFERVVLFNQL